MEIETLKSRHNEAMAARSEKIMEFLGDMGGEIKDPAHDDSVWAFQVQIENRSATTAGQAQAPRHFWWWKVRQIDGVYWFQQLSRDNKVKQGFLGSGGRTLAGDRHAGDRFSCTRHKTYITIEIHVIHPGELLGAEEESIRTRSFQGRGNQARKRQVKSTKRTKKSAETRND
jgi:hypothetical protein